MSELFRKLICANFLLSSLIISTPIEVLASSEESGASTLNEFLSDNKNIEKRLDTFLEVCSEDGSEEYAPAPDYSCVLEAEALAPILDALEKQDTHTLVGECNEREEILSRETISFLKEDLSGELQCRKEDAELYEATCSKEFNCNILRPGISAAQALPGMIEKRVTNFLESRAEAMNAGASCLDESRSSCLTEVWTTFYANIHDTLSSLGELAKLGWDSLWSLGSFFDRKSDELHVAASQTKEDVISLWRSPGEWMYKQFSKMKDGMEDWLKSSVFCQKWKGTPHMEDSVCEQPLETFGCIGCNDVTNAFCATAGVFASELLMVFTTAGVVNTTAMGAKIGLKLGADAAVRVSAKIAQTAPKMMKFAPEVSSAAASNSRIARASKVATEVVLESSKIMVRVGAEKIAETKALIARYKDGLMNSRAIKVAAKVAEVTSTPMIYFDRAAAKGIIASERLLGRALPGTYGRYMRRRSTLRELPLDPNNPATHRIQFAMRHQARGARQVATYENNNHKRTTKARNEQSKDSAVGENERSPRPASAEEARRRRDEREREQRVGMEERSREQERRRSEAERKQAHEHGTQASSEGRSEGRTSSRLGTALVVGDVGLKSFNGEEDRLIVEEFDNLKEEALSGGSRSASAAPIESREAALKTLAGNSDKPVHEREASERYRELSRTYAEENRANYIDNAVAATGVSSDVAGEYFDRRKHEVEQAGRVLFPKQSIASEKQRKVLTDLKAQLDSLDEEMDSLGELAERDGRGRESERRESEEAWEREQRKESNSVEERTFADSNISSSRGSSEGAGHLVGARAGVVGSGATPAIATFLGEAQDGNRWSAFEGEVISAPEEKILEGLINVNALHFIEGAPLEMTQIEDEFGLGLDNAVSHGKIRSGQGEFLFIRSSTNIFIFKRKGSDWIKINSPHLDRLIKAKMVANR